jgi:hypothetical protein
VKRQEPGLLAEERQALEQWTDFHRATLLQKCAGLAPEQLKTRSTPPSGLSLLGLVRHMTEVERWWFRMHAAQEDVPFLYWSDAAPEGDFIEVDGADPGADLAAYRAECEASRSAVAGLPLGHVVPSRGDHPERVRNLRWIYLHMIEGYARHNGHADLVRERIDGVTGD